MGEISDALKRAKTRLHSGQRGERTDPGRRDADGIAALLKEEERRRDRSPESAERPATSSPAHAPAESSARSREQEPASPAPHHSERPQTPEEAIADTAVRREVPRFTIPDKRTGHVASRIVAVAPESQFAVRFRHLAIRIRGDLANRHRSSVLVTSAVSGEGKTTVSINLALALASIAPESSIALVDLDLRRARVAVALDCAVDVGFEEVLGGRAALAESCIPTDFGKLDLYPVRQANRAPHQELGTVAAANAIEDLHSRYDYVIIDGPPVLPVPDVPLIESKIGGCLLVLRSRFSRHAGLVEMMELLPRRSILGVFLNEAISKRDRHAYSYDGQYATKSAED